MVVFKMLFTSFTGKVNSPGPLSILKESSRKTSETTPPGSGSLEGTLSEGEECGQGVARKPQGESCGKSRLNPSAAGPCDRGCSKTLLP